jgi:hypothetical protein
MNAFKHDFRSIGLFLAAAGTAVGQPLITTQPEDQTNYVGTTATFTVVATGTAPVSYQWQKFTVNFADVPHATNALLTLVNVQTNDVADYRVVVTDATGTTNSAAVHLTVALPETLFISNSAPGSVALSWRGNMVLLEALTPCSGCLDCAAWFRVGDASPVTVPVRAGARYFRLVALPSAAELQADFWMNLDRCRLNDRKACEDCVADFFLMGPTGELQSNQEAEEAASTGIELGSCISATEASALYGLKYGVQPQP